MSNSIIFFLSKVARIAILQLGDIFTFIIATSNLGYEK